MNDFEKLLIGEIHGIRKALQTITSGLQGETVKQLDFKTESDVDVKKIIDSVEGNIKLNSNDLSKLGNNMIDSKKRKVKNNGRACTKRFYDCGESEIR